jgi:hypothetical protein
MMLNAGENLSNLWRARKGLIVLLLAGGLICVLAVVAPHAWATPDQKPLAQTITDIDNNPDPPDCVWQCDGPIYMSTTNAPFGGLTASDVPVYVTNNIAWTKDVTKIGDPGVVVFNQTTVDIVNGDFSPNPALIWDKPQPGYYDVFIDVNGNGELNDGDGIVGSFGTGGQQPWVGAGICVDPCDVGGASLPARAGFRPVWFGLAALISVGAGAALVWKRRRG